MNLHKTLSFFIIATLSVSPAIAGGDDDKEKKSSSSNPSSSSSSRSTSSSSQMSSPTSGPSGFSRYFGPEGRRRYEEEQRIRNGRVPDEQALAIEKLEEDVEKAKSSLEEIDKKLEENDKKKKEIIAHIENIQTRMRLNNLDQTSELTTDEVKKALDEFENRGDDLYLIQRRNSLLKLKHQFHPKYLNRFKPESKNGEPPSIQSHEVLVWMLILEHNEQISIQQIREVIGDRRISQEAFDRAIEFCFRTSIIDSHWSSIEGLPRGLSGALSTGQFRLILELSFHGLTEIYDWGTNDRLLKFIQLSVSNSHFNTAARVAFVEYFINRGYDIHQRRIGLTPEGSANLIEMAMHHYCIPTANLLLFRGESVERPLVSRWDDFDGFTQMQSTRRSEYAAQVGNRFPPGIAALVLNFAGYSERVEYAGSRGSERLTMGEPRGTSWFHRGLTAVVTWLSWGISRLCSRKET
jgi:hypothetical protein